MSQTGHQHTIATRWRKPALGWAGRAYDLHCCVFPNSHFGILWNTPDKHKHQNEQNKPATKGWWAWRAYDSPAARTVHGDRWVRSALLRFTWLSVFPSFCLYVFLSICLFVFVSLSLFVFLYTGILKFTWQAIFQDLSLIILHTPIFLVAMYKEKMTIDWTHTDVVYCKQESAEWCNQLAQVLIATKRKTARRWWGFPACKLSDNKILMTSPMQQVVAHRDMSLETCTRVKYNRNDPDLMVQGQIQVAIVQH